MARILTVDDQPLITRVISGWLERHGHTVTRCADGREALASLASSAFEVLITDIDMPIMDGLTLLSHVDILKKLAGVIVVTGRTDYRELAVANDLKLHILPKPFSPTAMYQLIGAILQTAPEKDCVLSAREG